METSVTLLDTEIVDERYRFTNTGNGAMRIVGALGGALAGLSAIRCRAVAAEVLEADYAV